VLAPVTESAVGPDGLVGAALSDATDVLDSGTETAAGADASLGDTITTLSESLTTSVDAAAAPLNDTITSLSEPLTATVDAAAAPLGDTTTSLTEPLTATVDTAAAPLDGRVTSDSGPLTTTIDAGSAARRPGADTAAGGGALVPDGSEGPLTSPAPALSDSAANVAAPATAEGASAFVQGEAPGSLPGTPTPMQATPGGDDAAGFPPAAGFADSPEVAADLNPPASDVTAPSASPDDSLLAELGAVAELASDPRLLVSAAVLAAAAGTLLGARASGGGAGVGLAVTHVRLLPCLVKASVERNIELLTLAVGRGGGASAVAAPPTLTVGDGPGSRAASGDDGRPRTATTARVVDVIEKLMDPVRGGFNEVVRDAPDGSTDGLSDSRLMTQIGMLFGFVYLGFLTVWFWATRVRGSRSS
jgi:hypothetical protein